MPKVYKGNIQLEDKNKYEIVCILDKDIKINVYKSLSFSDLLTKTGGHNIAQGELIESYVSFIEKDAESKSFKRRTFTYGKINIVNEILNQTSHSFMENEEIHNETIQELAGFVQNITYRKETGYGTVEQIEKLLNGVRLELEVKTISKAGGITTLYLRHIGNSSVTKTKGIEYSEQLFDIGDVREKAIHTQVRSLQHLRKLKDLSWIEKLIESGNLRVVDTVEGIVALVQEILGDFARTGEKKIYYDTEGTGLNIMNLPPDHPEKDMMAAHVIAWVKEREENGYPKNVVSVTIPVGMKFVNNVDEIVAKDLLRPLLTNPNIGVVSHNSDYELQINARYSEIEGELSYNEYYNWLKKFDENSNLTDLNYYKEQINHIDEKIKEVENNDKILLMMKTSQLNTLRNKRKEYLDLINQGETIDNVFNLPKEQKPYLSKIKGENIYKVNIKYDTLVLSRMVNNGANDKNGNPFFRHRLDFLTENYLNLEQLSLDDIYGNSESSKYKIYDFSLLPEEFLYYYAGPDGWTLPHIEWHLENAAYNHMLELGYSHDKAYLSNLELLNLYYHVDVPFTVHQSLYANYKGIAIDKEKLDKEREEQEKIRDSIQQLMADLTGEEISWTSVKQVGSLIFHKYKYPIKFRTEKDKVPSYNKSTRKLHSNQTKDKHDAEYDDCVPIPEMTEDLIVGEDVILKKDVINNMMCPLSYIYQAFMDRHKDLTSFTQMIYDRTYNVNGEWIYFPNYTSTSTDTGRAAGGIMIMKAAKKDMFIARKNHILLGGDLDQAELRLIATMAGDLEEIQRFKHPKYDPHTQTASDVNNVKMEDVTGEMRGAAKVINFGIAYGIGAKAATANIYPNLVPTPEHLIAKTAVMIKEYNRTYICRSTWLDNLKQSTVKCGYSKTPYGRYKFFPDTRKEDVEEWELGRMGRQGGNVPIQGACADYIKQRIVWMFKEIEDAKITRFFSQPIFVHDEFFAEVDTRAFMSSKNKVYTTEMVKEEQQFNLLWMYNMLYSKFTETSLGIEQLEDEAPMTMGIGIGPHWKAAKSDLYGCPQELQVELINKYRNGLITDELHEKLCNKPIETLLDLIRTWWATQVKNELVRLKIDTTNLPNKLQEHVEDLFLKRNLKDIFPVSPQELEEIGLEKDNFFTGQCIKALRYLEGDKVKLQEIYTQDKEEGVYDIVYGEGEDYTGFESLSEMKDYYKYLEGGIITDYDRENIEMAYASVFKESSLMVYNRYMAYEESKIFEFNIRYLMRDYVIKLEKLIRKYDGLGNYKVCIIKRDDGNLFGEEIKTTYRVPLNINILSEVKVLYEENDSIRKNIEGGA